MHEFRGRYALGPKSAGPRVVSLASALLKFFSLVIDMSTGVVAVVFLITKHQDQGNPDLFREACSPTTMKLFLDVKSRISLSRTPASRSRARHFSQGCKDRQNVQNGLEYFGISKLTTGTLLILSSAGRSGWRPLNSTCIVKVISL